MTNRLLLVVAALASGAVAFTAAWAILRPPPPEPPGEGFSLEAPAFSLQGTGGAVSSASLRGRPWIANFVFTRCTTVCPVMTARMAELDRTLPPGVRLVSFSVDPGHDTPEVLRAWMTSSGLRDVRWAFVTWPTRVERDRAVRGFLLTSADTPEDAANPILHDSRFVLVDADGMVRGFYSSDDPDAMRRLRRDAVSLSMRGLYGLPAVHASLNAASVFLMIAGLMFIRRRREVPHAVFMSAAVLASILFLVSYLTYHANAGSTKFPGEGPARTAYLVLLLSHTVLAAIVPVLVGIVLWKILRGGREAHRRWARVTVPVWGYVSVTGVLIYWILFRAA
ncbi:MAG: DUF420 domain-containing protein [Candidatus Brocadiae bacterium]|nr:DUF420 domain-containing protein [Candidatus Brocadiia bacterium]